MEKEIKFTESKVEAETPAEQPMIEQDDVDIEQEPFNAEKILEDEKDKLDKFRLKNKFGKLVSAFTLVSAFALSAGKYDEAFATEKQSADSQKIEMTSDRQQAAHALIDALRSLPDNPNARTDAQNGLMKKRVAMVLIQKYALEATGKSSGFVRPEEMSQARKELKSVFAADVELSDSEKQFLKSVL